MGLLLSIPEAVMVALVGSPAVLASAVVMARESR